MPSSSPLDPKATIFVSEVPSKPAGKLNPKAAVFVPAPKAPVFEPVRQQNIVQGLLQQFQTPHRHYVYYR